MSATESRNHKRRLACVVQDGEPPAADAANPAAATAPAVQGGRMSILKVTDETTRAELEEAIANLNATLHRMPDHWTERRAKLHARIDALLVDWERAT